MKQLPLYSFRLPTGSGLFFWCRPLTVFRTIVSIVVDAIKSMSRGGFRTHILDEIENRLKPSVANFDPARTVIAETLFSRVRATPNHIKPCEIKRVFCQSFGVNPLSAVFLSAFNKVFAANVGRRAARTVAKPNHRTALSIARKGNRRQASKCFSGKSQWTFHAFIFRNFAHNAI